MLLRLRLDLVLAAFVQHEGGKGESLFSLFFVLLRTLRSKPGILESNLAHKPVVAGHI